MVKKNISFFFCDMHNKFTRKIMVMSKNTMQNYLNVFFFIKYEEKKSDFVCHFSDPFMNILKSIVFFSKYLFDLLIRCAYFFKTEFCQKKWFLIKHKFKLTAGKYFFFPQRIKIK